MNAHLITSLIIEVKKKYEFSEEKARDLVERAVKDMAAGLIVRRSSYKKTDSTTSYIQRIQIAQKRDDADELSKALNELCEAEQPEQDVFNRKIHSMIKQLSR